MYKTTEIASSDIVSDNPVHQRLLFPYIEVAKIISGNLLEIGCGTGRGVAVLAPSISNYTGVDKNEPLMTKNWLWNTQISSLLICFCLR